MDRLLYTGDKLYRDIVQTNPGILDHGGLLSSSDLPEAILLFGKRFSVHIDNEVHGSVDRPSVDALLNNMPSYAILVSGHVGGAYAVALFTDQEYIYLFDSHSRSPISGMPCENGTAVLLRFVSISSVAAFITRSAQVLHATQISLWKLRLTQPSLVSQGGNAHQHSLDREDRPAKHADKGKTATVRTLPREVTKESETRTTSQQTRIATECKQNSSTQLFDVCDTLHDNSGRHSGLTKTPQRDSKHVGQATHVPAPAEVGTARKQSRRHSRKSHRATKAAHPVETNRKHRRTDQRERLSSTPEKVANRLRSYAAAQNNVTSEGHKHAAANQYHVPEAHTHKKPTVTLPDSHGTLHGKRGPRHDHQEEQHKGTKSASTDTEDCDDPDTFHCSVCGLKIKHIQQETHRKRCTDVSQTSTCQSGRVACTYCCTSFPNQCDLDTHVETSHLMQYLTDQAQLIKSKVKTVKHKIYNLNKSMTYHTTAKDKWASRHDQAQEKLSQCTDELCRHLIMENLNNCKAAVRSHDDDIAAIAVQLDRMHPLLEGRLQELHKVHRRRRAINMQNRMRDRRADLQKRKMEPDQHTDVKRQRLAEKSDHDDRVKEKNSERMRSNRSDQAYRDAENHHKKASRKNDKHGTSLTESVDLFTRSISVGPIYVCSSCLQLNFPDYVCDVKSLHPGQHTDLLQRCLTNTLSVDNTEWICVTCKVDIYQDKIPKLSRANLVGFPDRPPELVLNNLEEMLIAPLLPFMTIRALPVCGNVQHGQKQVVGNVVHVPNDIASTVQSLPRLLDEMGTISVKLKRKKSFKTSVFHENIRPVKVVQALDYLIKHSSMFHHYNIHARTSAWLEHLTSTTHENRAYMEGYQHTEPREPEESVPTDEFEEIDSSEQTQGNMSTMLDENVPIHLDQSAQGAITNAPQPASVADNACLNLAPGEGKIPVFREPNAEYLCFPTLFCGNTRPTNRERTRRVTTADLFKAEARHSDTRVSMNISNLFWKAKHLQVQQIASKVTLALRRVKGPEVQQINAKILLDKATRDKITRLDEGYYIFRTIRSSPAYFLAKKKELMAMVRQLGIPSVFFSLSAADISWMPLLKTLGLLVDGKTYTDTFIQNEMTFDKKCQLVASHPTVCSRYFSYRVKKFFKHVLSSPHSNFGVLQDYFYRVEFQKRGSPHIHGLCWMKGAPLFNVQSEQQVCDYIDKCISCSLNVPEDQQCFVRLQAHKHSKTCRRVRNNTPTCRFGAPWPPMKKTCILHPIESTENLDIKELTKLYNGLKPHLKKVDQAIVTHSDWLKVINMSERDYINCIRTALIRPKVFLRRLPSETRINAYMKDLLAAWKGNHDVQFVLDPYQCVTYICDYMTKSHKEMSHILEEACEQAKAQNMTLKESVRHMGNKFINASETSAQEASFDVMQLLITDSTRKKEHISTCEQQHRVALTKSLEELEQLKPDSKDVTHKSNIERYAMRPKQLESWCLADYISKLDLEYPKKEDNSPDDSGDHPHDDELIEASDIMSHHITKGSFPIQLQNGLKLKLRSRPKIIRFVNYRHKTHPEDYARERLMLYTSWRKEDELLCGFETYEQSLRARGDVIMAKLAEYEPLSSVLEEVVDEMENYEVPPQDITLAPSTQHADLEDDPHDVISDSTGQLQVGAPSFDIGPALGLPSHNDDPLDVEFNPTILNDNEYARLISSLNKKQQEFHSHIIHNAVNSDRQTLCALHGGAGTGKSTVIRAIHQSLFRILNKQPGEDPSTKKVLLVAPTGKAAYNIKGITAHKAFQIPASQKIEYRELTKDKLNTVRSTFLPIQWIIIDEFSMVGNRMLQFIYLRLQEITGTQLPFGGLNIICVGDLYQLQPVMQKYIFMDIDAKYGPLATNLWKEHFTMFDLKEIMRQKDDKPFANLLNRLRRGRHTEEDLAVLRTRLISREESFQLTHIPHFYPTREETAAYNMHLLEMSSGFTMTVKAMDATSTDVSTNTQQAIIAAARNKEVNSAGNLPFLLTLKVGQQYDVTANVATEDGIMNGAECRLQFIEPNVHNADFPLSVWVKFSDPSIGKERRKTYVRTHPQYVHQQWTPIEAIQRAFTVRREHTVIRTQFPLRLASARTIHVAQSSTYENIVVDMSTSKRPPDHWWEHMHYVAFSRCTSLQGLHIVNLNTDKIRCSKSVTAYLQCEKKEMPLCFLPSYDQTDSFCVTYNNVGGLHSKWNMVSSNYHLTSASVIILAETWLTPEHADNDYELDNYHQFREDSTSVRARRGLIIYVHNTVRVIAVRFTQTQYLEAVICVCRFRNQTIQLVGLYKPPATRQTQFLQDMRQLIATLELSKPVLIVGDFNINILCEENSRIPVHFSDVYNLRQLVSTPTTQQRTCIDLALTNISNASASPLAVAWSLHHIITCIIDSCEDDLSL